MDQRHPVKTYKIIANVCKEILYFICSYFLLFLKGKCSILRGVAESILVGSIRKLVVFNF